MVIYHSAIVEERNFPNLCEMSTEPEGNDCPKFNKTIVRKRQNFGKEVTPIYII